MAKQPTYKALSFPTSSRDCLKCRLPFQSRGNGHRLCSKCAGSNAGLSKQAAESTSASVDVPENDLPGYA
jgi:hypothetical protein